MTITLSTTILLGIAAQYLTSSIKVAGKFKLLMFNQK